ncbi:amino acid ABC transporter substrate-binding protein [Halopseudomonas nanhaiensis]|uniref:substrate-binding periplasmic protein n=1 Tax=Halopseudomonas nanhaiensis TaxID=2830842 RepID=UPI001CBAC7DE|nr:transporter substrate-binding domain-containing protein [Halopseudomonas nanhaiensis]UAW96910.1 amino acid ABC transporter substrate-binding protein [Halopseudomonas nanhaiensis]
MRWARWMVGGLVLTMAGTVAASGTCERIVVTGDPQYPPVLWTDPDDSTRLTGAAIELLERTLEGSGVKVEALKVASFSVAEDEVRSGRIDMLAGVFLTPDRLGYMDYVHPAYLEVPSVLFVKRGASFAYSGWDDLRERRGATAAGARFGRAFDTYARDNLDLRQEKTIEQAFQRLLNGRADYVVFQRHQGLALAEQLGVADQLDILDGSVMNERLYFAVSHNSACNSPALRAALAQGMHRLTQEGEPRRLFEKYRDRWAGRFNAALPDAESELAD